MANNERALSVYNHIDISVYNILRLKRARRDLNDAIDTHLGTDYYKSTPTFTPNTLKGKASIVALQKIQQMADEVVNRFDDNWALYRTDPLYIQHLNEASDWMERYTRHLRSPNFKSSSVVPQFELPRLPRPFQTLDDEMIMKAQKTVALRKAYRTKPKRYRVDPEFESKEDNLSQSYRYPQIFQPSGDIPRHIASFHGGFYVDSMNQARQRLTAIRTRREELAQEIPALVRSIWALKTEDHNLSWSNAFTDDPAHYRKRKDAIQQELPKLEKKLYKARSSDEKLKQEEPIVEEQLRQLETYFGIIRPPNQRNVTQSERCTIM